MLRIEGIFTEFRKLFPVNNLFYVLIVEVSDILNLVACPETVKEIQKRNMAADSRKVRDSSQVHAVLNARACQKCEPSLTARHNIGLFSVDSDCVSCPCEAVHCRDHEH